MTLASSVPKSGQTGPDSEGRTCSSKGGRKGGCWYHVRGDAARGLARTEISKEIRLGEKDGTRDKGLHERPTETGGCGILASA